MFIFSRDCFMYRGQLSQIISEYSRIGLMNEKYMICNDFLSSWNFSDLRILSLVWAFVSILFIWSPQWRLLLNISPRCLCLSISFTWMLFIERGGWSAETVFLEINRLSVFWGLKFTSQFSDHLCTFSKLKLSSSPAVFAFSIIMYIVVSSANSFMEQFTSRTISFIKTRKKRGPRMDPWGTPAFIFIQSDSVPFTTTLCFLENK